MQSNNIQDSSYIFNLVIEISMPPIEDMIIEYNLFFLGRSQNFLFEDIYTFF